MRYLLSVSLLLAALAGGCQTGGSASPSAADASATPATDRESVPADQILPAGIDDDSDFDPPSQMAQAVESPFKAVGDGVTELFAWPTQAIQTASGDTPRRAVNQMQDKNSADNRRNGLNRLMEYPYTHRPPYTKVYEGMATLDKDPTVRAAAVRACNRSRDHKATPVFIKALSDSSEMVRLEGAKGLANIPDPNAATPLVAIANNPDEDRDVRIAAIDAVKYYHTLEVARVLSGLLTDHDFSICWQARRSLVYLTHKDFGYDQGAWLGYFVGPAKPFG
ncbi:MAG TPA: HEAT repeat domain-containing protein [Tepidisphaeraceae bacterium]|nr:HEAT repeat domain-containing protein [Tepidisphaeraceae bacterium]